MPRQIHHPPPAAFAYATALLELANERSLNSFLVDGGTGALTPADTAPLHAAPAALVVATIVRD